ncbi:hypothetical protein [Streptomyces sp. NPDC127100]|uniref:hypothetical protein n=1 Tax=Streptomyces sp. NPDC127100 TaxID=3347138 RepID=UPI003667CC09
MPITRLQLTADDLAPGTRVLYLDRAGIPLQVTVAEVHRLEGVFTTRATRATPALVLPLADAHTGRIYRRPTRGHRPRIAPAGSWFVTWCTRCGWQTSAFAVEAAARYQFHRYHRLTVRKAHAMLRSTAALLTTLAATALQDQDIDMKSIEVSEADGLALITFASSGDAAYDRGMVELINGELCLSQDPRIPQPVYVRPKDDDAALAAAADSLRHLATLLDRSRTGAPQQQMDRTTALRFAENVLSSTG